jgi:hypothetical protein
MDGDEEPRPGNVVTVEPGTGDAVADDTVTDEAGTDDADTDDAVADDATADVDAPVADDAEPADAAPAEAEAGSDEPAVAPPAAVPTRRRKVRRSLIAAGAALAVALSVGAFALAGPTTGTSANVDQRFVDAAQTQGHVIAADQQPLVLSAARKICDRRENHATVPERRATALSAEELAAIQQSFATDIRGFTSLALDTYCPS